MTIPKIVKCEAAISGECEDFECSHYDYHMYDYVPCRILSCKNNEVICIERNPSFRNEILNILNMEK